MTRFTALSASFSESKVRLLGGFNGPLGLLVVVTLGFACHEASSRVA